MIVIDREAPWMLELAWLIALLAELGHERAAIIIIVREYLQSMVASITDEQETSMMVEHQAHRIAEQAISIVFSLGADRELDSSISIKSIVSHLFPIRNLTVTPSQRRRDILNLHKPLEPAKRSRRTRSDNETTNEGKNSTTNKQSPSPSRPLTNPITNPNPSSQSLTFHVDWCCFMPQDIVLINVCICHREITTTIMTTTTRHIKGTRRSRTRARSESSTSPMTHRPAIESSSSSRPLA